MIEERRLQAAVNLYEREHRERSARELGSFHSEPTLRAAIERAARARQPNGRRYSHQARIPQEVLEELRRRLLDADLESCRTFDELHEAVRNLAAPIHGAGELLVYDTALRIGAKLALLPERVYLHRGAREGARALGLNWRATSLSVDVVPPALRALAPHEIEDCLCIYKDLFNKASSAR